jgi:hypothetical protein
MSSCATKANTQVRQAMENTLLPGEWREADFLGTPGA